MRKYYVGNGRYWKKSDFRYNFDGSNELFEYCWRKAIAVYVCAGDMCELLDAIASEAVNDERSKFYIHG